MKTNSIQQEILLITGTRFFSRQWCKNDEQVKPETLTEKEKLEEACWNGLLYEMLPEICVESAKRKDMYLWQIRSTESFLELELGEFPEERDSYFSIDPYSFLAATSEN